MMVNLNDREVEYLKDVPALLPDDVKPHAEMIASLVNIEEDKIPEISKLVNEKNFKDVMMLIESAFFVRPVKAEVLVKLMMELKKRFIICEATIYDGSLTWFLVRRGVIEATRERKVTGRETKPPMIDNYSIIDAILADDVDKYITFESDTAFNPNKRCNMDWLEYAYIKPYFSYAQLIAFTGAINCFKHIVNDTRYDLNNIQNYAVRGGNLEIIHICEQKSMDLAASLIDALCYHHFEVADWLLTHYECTATRNNLQRLFRLNSIIGIFFLMLNGRVTANLVEEGCFLRIPDAVLNNLIRRFPSSIWVDAVNTAIDGSNPFEEINLLIRKLKVDVNKRDEHDTAPIEKAIDVGSAEVVRLLVEHYHADIEIENEYGFTPLKLAIDLGNFMIARYLLIKGASIKHAYPTKCIPDVEAFLREEEQKYYDHFDGY